ESRAQQCELEKAMRPKLQTIIPKIVGSLGMLHSKSEPGEREYLVQWYVLAQALKMMFDFKQKPWESEMEGVSAQYSLYLVPRRNKIELTIRPPNLCSAIMIHAMRSLAGGTRFSACEQCATPFLSGGGRGAAIRKAGTRFCSERCRWDFNNARRKN